MTQLNLHKIEKKILLSLVNDDKIEIEKLATLTNLSLDNVRRGIESLSTRDWYPFLFKRNQYLN